MKTIPGNSIVAVFSTSVFLLPAGTADKSVPETSTLNEEDVTDHASDDDSSEKAPRDIFIAYERMKTNSSLALNNMDASSGSHTKAARQFGPGKDAEDGSTGGRRAPYDPYGVRQRKPICNQTGLLVTASPSRLATSRHQRDHGDDSATSSPGKVIDETEETGRRRFSTGSPRSPGAPREPPAIRLSDVAPLPLLVFDTETFLALGELDERFAFQGGIAAWISRAKLGSGDPGSGTHMNTDGYCLHASSSHCDGAPGSTCATLDRGTSTRSSCLANTVQHVHEQEWGRQFVGSYSDDVVTADDTVQSKGYMAEQRVQNTLSSSAITRGNFGQPDQAEEQVVPREGGEQDGPSQPGDSESARKPEEAILDQRTRLTPAKLEALVQADADLFFLPLILSWRPSGELTSRNDRIHESSFFQARRIVSAA